MAELSMEAKLGLDAYKLDTQPHIVIDHSACTERCAAHPCLHVCPADLYTLDAEGRVQVDWEGCLECGTCLIVCPADALSWAYPRAGYGVHFRFG